MATVVEDARNDGRDSGLCVWHDVYVAVDSGPTAPGSEYALPPLSLGPHSECTVIGEHYARTRST